MTHRARWAGEERLPDWSAGFGGGPGFAWGGVRTVDFPSVPAGGVASATVTVAGAEVGDFVVATLRSVATGVVLQSAEVTAADTVTLRAYNPTAAAVDPAPTSVYLVIVKAP